MEATESSILPASAAGTSTSAQLLSLKVMRLSRPALGAGHGMRVTDPVDPMSQLISDVASGGEASSSYVVGEYLAAPVQFENIYLGETFTFLVNCINESDTLVRDIAVKVELQTATQRHSINCKALQIATLAAHDSAAEVLHHEVKEPGQHILVCSVTYTASSGGEPLFLRKFFKFPVGRPIDVKTKLYNAEDNAVFDVFLEAQIESTCQYPMRFERCILEPSPSYTVTALAPKPEGAAGTVLKNGEVLQVLFGLRASESAVASKDVTKIGKLDMEWRTRLGERGRLQTSPLERIIPGTGELNVKITRLPSSVRAREPFGVECLLRNTSDKPVECKLIFDSTLSSALVYCCPSGIALGTLPPRSALPFSMTLLPTTLGFQSISGIRVEDVHTKRLHEFDDIAQVFVV